MEIAPGIGVAPPIEHPPLRPFFERIIDKKVNQVALNIFERCVDFLCSYIYKAYHLRLTFRLAEGQGNQAAQAVQQAVEKEKVLDIGGAPLFDRTSDQCVTIKQIKLCNIVAEVQLAYDAIMLKGKQVKFDTGGRGILIFGKDAGTKHVIVTNVEECPELVMIHERETNANLKVWYVNTTKPTKEIVMGGQIPIVQREVFLAHQMPLQPEPEQIQVPLIG